MDDNTRVVLLAVVAAIPATLAALAAVLMSLRNHQDIRDTDRRAEQHLMACHAPANGAPIPSARTAPNAPPKGP